PGWSGPPGTPPPGTPMHGTPMPPPGVSGAPGMMMSPHGVGMMATGPGAGGMMMAPSTATSGQVVAKPGGGSKKGVWIAIGGVIVVGGIVAIAVAAGDGGGGGATASA